MIQDPAQIKLKAFPLQLIDISTGIILKRGCEELKVSGKGAAEAARRVLGACAVNGATRQEICELFSPQARMIVDQLIDQLLSRRFLIASSAAETFVEKSESSLDIFYWHFEEEVARVTERLNHRKIVILGVTYISRQLTAAFAATGVRNFEVVDHPLLRNHDLFDHAGKLISDQLPRNVSPPLDWTSDIDSKHADCFVATSDFGAQKIMRDWNRICVQRRIHFLPVVLQNLIGYVGPLVIPGETACFECLRARQNSHLKDCDFQGAADSIPIEGQGVIGFHPSMASILGDIAAFELTKFYSEAVPSWNVGTLIEVNLLATRLTTRKVLKVPRCLVCSPLNTQPSTIPDQASFVSYGQDSQ